MNALASRRQLFGASAALLVLGTAGGSASASSDAALLAACEDYHRAHAEWMHPCWTSDEECDELNGIRQNAFMRVVAMQPQTPEGLKAKASVALGAMMFEVDHTLGADWRDNAEVEEILVIDVLRGFLGERVA